MSATTDDALYTITAPNSTISTTVVKRIQSVLSFCAIGHLVGTVSCWQDGGTGFSLWTLARTGKTQAEACATIAAAPEKFLERRLIHFVDTTLVPAPSL